MKYRRRPGIVDAVLYTEGKDGIAAVLRFCPQARLFPPRGYETSPFFLIKTLEGNMELHVGEWIVRGIKGEYYPVKPDIFSILYEAEEAPNA